MFNINLIGCSNFCEKKKMLPCYIARQNLDFFFLSLSPKLDTQKPIYLSWSIQSILESWLNNCVVALLWFFSFNRERSDFFFQIWMMRTVDMVSRCECKMQTCHCASNDPAGLKIGGVCVQTNLMKCILIFAGFFGPRHSATIFDHHPG